MTTVVLLAATIVVESRPRMEKGLFLYLPKGHGDEEVVGCTNKPVRLACGGCEPKYSAMLSAFCRRTEVS